MSPSTNDFILLHLRPAEIVVDPRVLDQRRFYEACANDMAKHAGGWICDWVQILDSLEQKKTPA